MNRVKVNGNGTKKCYDRLNYEVFNFSELFQGF